MDTRPCMRCGNVFEKAYRYNTICYQCQKQNRKESFYASVQPLQTTGIIDARRRRTDQMCDDNSMYAKTEDRPGE